MKRRTINTRPLNTAVPDAARIFDFLLDGTANFAADRQAVEKLLRLLPSTRKWVRLWRAFVQEAALRLREAGFTQFLDLGSGLPTQDHIHAVVPDARVLYSDTNPIAISYASNILADNPYADYIYGDVGEMDALLKAPETRQLIDATVPVAIGLNTLPLFVDVAPGREMCHRLHEWAAPGSKIFVALPTRQPGGSTPAFRQFLELFASAGQPLQFHSLDACRTMFEPWHMEVLEPVTRFLELPDHFITPEDEEGIGLQTYAAILARA